METGCSCQLLLNILLTLLGWIPGMIHAFCVVTDFCKKEDFLQENKKESDQSQNGQQDSSPSNASSKPAATQATEEKPIIITPSNPPPVSSDTPILEEKPKEQV